MAINSIKILKIEPCKNPVYIKPRLVTYLQSGIEKNWEIADTHDSVSILLYHEEREAFVFVKQFRPAVFMNNHDGYTVELCAGLVDKDKDIKVIAQEEILEECGYDVPLENIEKITAFHTAVGFAGGKQTVYFAHINESMKRDEGGGVDDEQIEVIYLPLKESRAFMFDESIAKTPGMLFALYWFMEHKKQF